MAEKKGSKGVVAVYSAYINHWTGYPNKNI
jgi:hypothetical protein